MDDRDTIHRRSLLVGGLAACPVSLGGYRLVNGPETRINLLVESFRRDGMSDRETISRALEAWQNLGGTLEFDVARAYDLGRVEGSDPVFAVRGVQDCTIIGNGARIIAETPSMLSTTIFYFRSFRNLRICGLRGFDRGADISRNWRGMRFIVADATFGTCENIELDDIHVENAVALFAAQGGGGVGPRISGITLRNVTAVRCYYGISCIENGDDLTAHFTAVDCRRAYFVYGVARHDVTLDIRHNSGAVGAQASCLIKRYERDTTDITLRARFTGVIAWQDLVKLEQQPTSGVGRIARVSVSLTVDPHVVEMHKANRLALSSVSSAGLMETSNDIWSDITLDGDLGSSGASAVQGRTRPLLPTEIYIASSARGSLVSQASGVDIRRGRAPNQPALPRKIR